MAVRYLGTNSSDGTVLGKSTGEKIGFYGATPVAVPANANQAQVRTTPVNTTNATSGLTTATTTHKQTVKDLNAVKTLVNQLQSDMVSLGLIKGSS